MFTISNLIKNFDILSQEEIITTLGDAFWIEFLSTEVINNITDEEWEKEYSGSYDNIEEMAQFVDKKYKEKNLNFEEILKTKAVDFRDKFIWEYIGSLEKELKDDQQRSILKQIKEAMNKREWDKVEKLFERLFKL